MGRLSLALLLLSSFLWAQDNSGAAKQQTSNGQITVQGCVDRERGDYVLLQQDPGMEYELQSTGKVKLSHYMGQRVEVTGKKQASLSTSSDAIAFGGSPSPVTIRVSSIKTLDAQCSTHQVKK